MTDLALALLVLSGIAAIYYVDDGRIRAAVTAALAGLLVWRAKRTISLPRLRYRGCCCKTNAPERGNTMNESTHESAAHKKWIIARNAWLRAAWSNSPCEAEIKGLKAIADGFFSEWSDACDFAFGARQSCEMVH